MQLPLQHQTPRLVAWLGYGGLVPFVAFTLASLLEPQRSGTWQQLASNYGAVILSFVGALHWGFAISPLQLGDARRNACLAWSVVPALVAWLALLLDPVAGSALMAVGFAVHYLQDWRLVKHAPLPGWYLPLRLKLSVVASVCLLVTSYASRV